MAQFFSAEVLKKTIEALQGAVNEARFDCNSNGIEVTKIFFYVYKKKYVLLIHFFCVLNL